MATISEEELKSLREQASKAVDLESQNKVLMSKQEETDKVITEMQEAQDQARFAAAKDEIQSRLEDLVKAETILPAARDEFMLKWEDSDDAIKSIEMSVSMLEAAKPKAETPNQTEQSKSDSVEEDTRHPSEIVLSRVSQMRVAEPALDFSTAKQRVFAADQELARQYIESNGEVA